MKDLVISRQRLRREAWVLLGCIVLACLTNACAIIAYKTNWSELLTAWQVTLGLALGLYVLFALPRLVWAGIIRLIRR